MLQFASTPDARRPDLIVRTTGERGECVVKDPLNSSYYRFGAEEGFLLHQLDGVQPTDSICKNYQERFGEPLAPAELQQFVDQARSLGLLQQPGHPAVVLPSPAVKAPPPACAPTQPAAQTAPPAPPKKRQSILYFRLSLFNPDRLLTAILPIFRFALAPVSLMLIVALGVASGSMLWLQRDEFLHQLPLALRWETGLLAWATIAFATLCHEFAHGLMCKRFGGEVRDMGFLMMYMMPCFYCNVSDAWLFSKKSQRLLVTLAGPLCDLFLWSTAAIVWRYTLQSSIPSYVAWVALSVLGMRLIFNFNPLMKLDGYYLLSDIIDIPNLRDRSWAFVRAQMRRIFWGAPAPAAEPRPVFLFSYGVASWTYSFAALCLIVAFAGNALITQFGWPGAAGTALIAWILMRGLFVGLFGDELSKMLVQRRLRTLCWTASLGCCAAALCIMVCDDTVAGTVLLRSTNRAEVRAHVAGFLAEVFVEETKGVQRNGPLVRLDIPDLSSRIAQKHAELDEADAKLRVLSAGPRPEDEAEQRKRIERAEVRLKTARADLAQRSAALSSELADLELKTKQARLEADWAVENFKSIKELAKTGAMSAFERDDAEKKWKVLEVKWEETKIQRDIRKTVGVAPQEAEVAKLEAELGEARSQLAILLAKTRSEDIDAAAARVAHVRTECCYLEHVQQSLHVDCPVNGLLATPHLAQNIGQYFKEGDLICEIEDPMSLEAEITVSEQDAARIVPGQDVRLAVRGMVLDTLNATVMTVSPKAITGPLQNSFVVHCRLKQYSPTLLPGMTGNARIVCGRKPLADILVDKVLRVLRTDFWW